MNVVYILFRENTKQWDAPFMVAVYENEEDAYNRKAEMFDSENFFIEEWEVQ